MSRNGEGSEGAQIATVLERDEGEGDYDEQNGLLVDVPPEEEGSIAAECNGANEGGPARVEEELDERNGLEEEGEYESHSRGNLRQNSKGCVADETPGNTVHGILVDGKSKSWSNIDQDPISKRIHCPKVRRPVSMTESSRERKQPV